jgi:RNA polymerase sigma-70 factor (ECF subfamily)
MDDELLAALARDLDGSFERLVRAHQHRLFSIALRLTGDPHDAEELAQDAFVRAHRALEGYDAERIRGLNLRAWLATIVLNLCRNRARRRRPTEVALDVAGTDPFADRRMPSPAERYERRESAVYWAGLVRDLPERYRAAVVLRHVDGLSYEEMAEVLARPVGTVKAQVHRGVALLRAAHEAAGRSFPSSLPSTLASTLASPPPSPAEVIR